MTHEMREAKAQWQRRMRQKFKNAHGYSQTSHYRAGGLREVVLRRDGRSCIACGMTDAQHKQRWDRPITIDHIDRNRTNNALSNLQTLCLSCHGKKDMTPSLIVPSVPAYREEITARRSGGATYQAIADAFGFSVRSIWKWCQRWESA